MDLIETPRSAFVVARRFRVPVAVFIFLLSSVMTLNSASADDFNVRAYGAVGDGRADDGPAIQRAIDAAIHTGRPSTVIVPAGHYLLSRLVMAGAHDISLVGTSGTVLIGTMPRLTILTIVGSSDVRVAGFTLDRAPELFAQGVVKQVDVARKAVTLNLDPQAGALDGPLLAQEKLLLVFNDPASGSWGDHSAACAFYKPSDPSVCWPPTIVARRRIDAFRWELMLNTPPEPGDLGKQAVVWSGVYKGRAFLILRSHDVTIADVTYFAEGDEGGFIVGHDSGTVEFDHFTMKVPPGSEDLVASVGGAMVFNNHVHLILDHVDISGSWDDCLNMGANFARIYAQLSPKVLQVDGSRADFAVGDHLSVWDWRLKAIIAHVAITQMTCEKKPSITCQLTLDQSVKIAHPGYAPVRSEGNDTDGIDRVIDVDGVGTLTVTNSSFQSLHARCLLIKASHALVENSLCHDTVMAGIVIGPSFFWDEGPETEGVTIRNTVFRNVSGPNVLVTNGGSSNAPAVTGIAIKDDQFIGYGRFRHGVEVGSGVPIILQKTANPDLAGNRTSSRFALPGSPPAGSVDDALQIK